jgi:bacterioferritin-associated ferredoxin
MYVCLCHALTDRQVRAAIDQGGARTPAQVYRQLGCTPRCGKCLPCVADMTRAADGGEEEPARQRAR